MNAAGDTFTFTYTPITGKSVQISLVPIVNLPIRMIYYYSIMDSYTITSYSRKL